MRNVNNTYLCQAKIILNNKKINLSHKRLRRLAYIDVHQLNYNLFSLYNTENPYGSPLNMFQVHTDNLLVIVFI